MRDRLLIVGLLVLLAMATRFIPHWPNFTAVGAVALFSGAMFKSGRWAILIPLAALYLSDLLLNNLILAEYYNGFQWFTPGFYFMYAAFILTALIGKYGVNNRKSSGIALGAVASALLFFIITNFGAWLGNPMYAQNLGGLFTSYAAGLPFLGNQVLGNLFYSAILFGIAYAALPAFKQNFKVSQ
jgi:hypothetical protein